MKIIINKSIAALGIKSVVIGIAKNVNPNAKLSDSFLKKQKKMEEWALNCNIDEVFNHPVIQGYKDLLQSVERSVKKKSTYCSCTYKKYSASWFYTLY